ncbi:MAG TPA: hypothetical protein VN923_08275 [Thermoanaerobaculia bacterium]|nr:hypothetical protein [Thermoanaerobaculia bacterium]
MTVRGVVGCVVMSGLLGTLAACASGGSSTAAAPEAEAMSAKAAAASMTPAGQVVIQVSPDCTVDVAAAHISEAKKQEARWELTGNPGPLGIEFKAEKGKNALDVSASSATVVVARIKLAKQQGTHPYRIQIGDNTCPDPVLIIDP